MLIKLLVFSLFGHWLRLVSFIFFFFAGEFFNVTINLNQFAVIPHRNAYEAKESYWFGLTIRFVIIAIYILTFVASVHYDSTILSKHKSIILKIGKNVRKVL